jgi:predicted DNA-binding WGR domain protein
MSDVALRRIEPEKNMARFYVVAVERTLFGDWAVVRNWGRIGSRGQSMETWFSHPSPADVLSGRLEASKRRRGYREVGC